MNNLKALYDVRLDALYLRSVAAVDGQHQLLQRFIAVIRESAQSHSQLFRIILVHPENVQWDIVYKSSQS